MQALVLERLLESLGELEESIQSAQRALLNKKGAEPELEQRLRQYESMLLQQRQLAFDLNDLIEKGSWESVARAVRIINGISTMLRDDARQVVASLSGGHRGTSGAAFSC